MLFPHLSAFGDEIDPDLTTQLALLESKGIRALELRTAWGVNVVELDAAQLRRARDELRARGFAVSAIASPVGKSGLEQPPAYEAARLDRAIAAAEALDCRLIRVFSLYVNSTAPGAARGAVLERMAALAARAERAGVLLVHENERGIYGETPERCHDLLNGVGSPALRQAFDPANFVQAGVRPLARAWPLLAADVAHVHIKDARLADGAVVPAGEGDGEIGRLLAALAARGYQGYLTLEPHLAVAGPAGGFSGAEGMWRAVRALRRLLDA
jgi:sugar phosphate isomerase/epimerase